MKKLTTPAPAARPPNKIFFTGNGLVDWAGVEYGLARVCRRSEDWMTRMTIANYSLEIVGWFLEEFPNLCRIKLSSTETSAQGPHNSAAVLLIHQNT